MNPSAAAASTRTAAVRPRLGARRRPGRGLGGAPRAAAAAQEAGSLAAEVAAYDALVGAIGGVRHGGCRLGHGARGRGLFAAAGATAEAPLLAGPLAATLLVAVDEAGLPAVDEAYAAWPDVHGAAPPPGLLAALRDVAVSKNVRLAAALLWGREASSVWRPYTEQFIPPPDEHPPLLLATADELAELQDEMAAMMLAGARSTVERGWEQFQECGAGDALEGVTRDEFEWAFAITHSRAHAVSLGGGAAGATLMPCADMANHRNGPNAEFVVDPDAGEFQLRWLAAQGEPTEGEEVLISYGERSPNAVLALNFGFVDAGNPNDGLPMDLLMPAMRRYRAGPLLEAAEARAGEEGAARFAAVARSLAALADEDADPSGEAAALAELSDSLSAKLEAYPTSAEEDAALLAAGSLPARTACAVAYRLEQKRLVLAALDLLGAATDQPTQPD